MFRGNRGYVLALGLIFLVFGAASWVLLPRVPELPAHNEIKSDDSANHPGGPGCKAARLASLSGDQAFSELDRCTQAAQQHDHDARDLIQQTRAADAAQASAGLSYHTLVLTWLGAIFGFGTLIIAIAAVWFAKRAADAADRSVKLALETSRAELRAYLGSSSETIEFRNEEKTAGQIVVSLVNRGSTPAHSFTTQVHSYIAHTNGGIDRSGTKQINVGTIPPGVPYDIQIPFKITPAQLALIKAGTAIFRADVRVTYLDTFHTSWTYEHDIVVDVGVLKGGPVGTAGCRQYENIEREDAAADSPELPMPRLKKPHRTRS